MSQDTVEWYYKRVTDMRVSSLLTYVKQYTSGKRVLDLGCAVGNYLQHFSEASVGVDASLPSLEICRKKRVTAKFGDLNKPLDFDSEEFDVVFCSHTLEHVESPISFLRECNRVLKSDGLIMVIVPLDMTFSIALGKHGYWRHHPEHLYSFSIENLKALLAKAHFESSKVFISPFLMGRLLNITNSVGNVALDLIQRLPKKLIRLFAYDYMIVARKVALAPTS
jgi:SAM-dependent methyltransferase